VVLAGTIQAAEVSGKVKGGPYAHATFIFNGEDVKVSQQATATLSQIGALVDWYPELTSGPQLHAGLSAGLGMISISNQADDKKSYGLCGSATLFGGFDWALGSVWAVGLGIVATGSTSASLKDRHSNKTGYKFMPLSIGVVASILYF
jgi:hypothetical protein